MKVLVVDDSRAVRLVVTNFFKDLRIEDVFQASDGREALELIYSGLKSKRPFDLVVADINMPNLTGIELVEKIKKNRKTKQIKIVLLTADERRSEEAFSIGADGYITKPFERETLQNLLKQIYTEVES